MFLPWPISHSSTKFCGNLFGSFWVILLTIKHINRCENITSWSEIIKKMFSTLILMEVQAVVVLWVLIDFSFSSTRTKLHSFTNHTWFRLSYLYLCFAHIRHPWNNSSGPQHRSRGTGPPGQWRKQLLLWQSRDLPPWTLGDGVWWPLGSGWCSGGVQTAGLWQGPVSTTTCTFWTGQWAHLVGRCRLLRQRIKADRVPAPRDWISQLSSQWGCWCRLWR